jgi:16S rRNA (guanine966-N2)-methyltransferase
MRIIAGEFRGRHLLDPESDTTRPITDRAKQSLFDILAPDLPEAVVYDCFCGTGSMGLESLSRGARHAVFFERDRSALRRLRQNIDSLDLSSRATVVVGDLAVTLRSLAPPPPDARPDVVFFDPPYRLLRESPDMLRELARRLAELHLRPGTGVLVFRHDDADDLLLPPLIEFNRRVYGSMRIELLRAPTNAIASGG